MNKAGQIPLKLKEFKMSEMEIVISKVLKLKLNYYQHAKLLIFIEKFDPLESKINYIFLLPEIWKKSEI